MGPNIHLIVNNVLCIISAVIITGTALFTYLNDRKSTVNIMIALAAVMAVIFYVSHVIGVSVSDPSLSRAILMFNLCMFPAGMFQLHGIAAVIGDKRSRKTVILSYALGCALLVFFLVFPDLFLLPSVPKMYFPNYYNPGALNWTRLAFLFGFVAVYTLTRLAKAYRRAESDNQRNQFKYIIIAFIGIYFIIFIPNFLVYDVPIDPVWGALAGIFWSVPIVYGAVRYGIFNVKVIAQQAFYYALAIGGVGALITLFNYSNIWIRDLVPGFPLWTTALFSAAVVVTASVVIWQKLRESDILKYEFITTATHKFRTPLTHVKWASENLDKSTLDEDQREQVKFIQEANAKMVELTNVLMNISEAENTEYEYRMERTDLSGLAKETFDSLAYQMRSKKIAVTTDIGPGLYAVCDAARIRFIVQTLIENAIHYTPDGGTVAVSLHRDLKGGGVVFSVKDSGIGISKEDLPLLFAKFYRGAQARLADTEGMGIGLYVAKEIMSRHKGRIWAESEGTGKGSTFSFSLPAAE